MRIIMKEYGKLIITSIVAILLLALFLSVRLNGTEGVLNILGASEILNQESLEQGNSEIVESNANINNPSILWQEDIYHISVGEVISIPTLFRATADNETELDVCVLGICYQGIEILVTEDEEGLKEYQQNVECFTFENAGIYQVTLYAVDEYGNETVKKCNLVVNQ